MTANLVDRALALVAVVLILALVPAQLVLWTEGMIQPETMWAVNLFGLMLVSLFVPAFWRALHPEVTR